MANFKVNFMLIGSMKCGTSTLAHILKNHPEIGFSRTKEPQFFSKTKDWKLHIKKYHELFNFEEGKIFGEASTLYTRYPHNNLEIWNDIYDYNNNMKFLYIVRNPVDRAISHYMHNYERGFINGTIEKSLKYSNIINTGRYFTQIKPFIDRFGLDNVLILNFDDLLINRTKVLKEISGFLEIDYNKFSDYEDVHENITIGGRKKSINQRFIMGIINKYKLRPLIDLIPERTINFILEQFFNNSDRRFSKKPKLSEEYRRLIINLNILDIIELEKITKKDFSEWKNMDNKH